MTNIAVHGAGGRMGRQIISVIAEDDNATLCAALGRHGGASHGMDAGVLSGLGRPLGIPVSSDLAEGLAGADVVIDFSLPAGFLQVLQACAASHTPLVVGTTGLDDRAHEAMAKVAKDVPVVFAPNFSVGVNVFWALAKQAAQLFADDVDLEIIEAHHRRKVDSPSGTAVRLLEVVAEARGLEPKAAARHGRSGQVGARTAGEIGVHAVRGGDVVGEHTLVLAGPGERIEMTHRAHSRDIFARGAVRAAHFLTEQRPGLYGMADVLGLPGHGEV